MAEEGRCLQLISCCPLVRNSRSDRSQVRWVLLPDLHITHSEKITSSRTAGWLLVILTQAGVILEERSSVEKMPPSDQPVGKSVEHFFLLMIDTVGLSPLWRVPPQGRMSQVIEESWLSEPREASQYGSFLLGLHFHSCILGPALSSFPEFPS